MQECTDDVGQMMSENVANNKLAHNDIFPFFVGYIDYAFYKKHFIQA